jgi:uncharacterized protein (DUF697 family)
MSPDQDDKPAASPLDAERERLREAGYTDAEISQILIARAAQQPAGAGQGVMSSALSSVVAVGSHARSVIPSFRKDVATIFDGAATASARAGATASLIIKAVVILVLGYAAWQEWNQHIISGPEIARQQAIEAKAKAQAASHVPCLLEGTTACDELEKNILAKKLEAEAREAEARARALTDCAPSTGYINAVLKAKREGQPPPPPPPCNR